VLLHNCISIKIICKRACSLVVIRVPVAPQILDSTPRGSEFLRIYRRLCFQWQATLPSIARRLGACDDFANLEDLPAVFEDTPRGRVCVCVFIGISVRAL
jgi:hypothetical protein